MFMDTAEVIVIGAGAAGLSTAAELGRRGIGATVLDGADALGSAWRGRYDRLRLNSSRWFSGLPGGRFGRGNAVFPSRDDMVDHLERYAERHRLDVRLGVRVERIDATEHGWALRTSAGDAAARQVVVATGFDATPYVPAWPGRDEFQGNLDHAAAYRNPERYVGSDVLVVGAGCSAMEIAYDLVDGGARRVRLAVRTPPNLLLRSPIGPAIAIALRRLPTRTADAIASKGRRKMFGDLTEFGLPEPEEGVFSRLERLGVAPAIVDMETIDAIRDGRIEVVAGVERLDATGVRLADGERIEPDAIIAATGYRATLEPLVGHLGILDARGLPRALAADEAAAGLRFVGFLHLPAHLRYMGIEASRAAKAIARQQRAARTRRPWAVGRARPAGARA
jgi:putative flavoprotein involved in K+ transport